MKGIGDSGSLAILYLRYKNYVQLEYNDNEKPVRFGLWCECQFTVTKSLVPLEWSRLGRGIIHHKVYLAILPRELAV